jgi:hypothetical protein
MKVCRSHVLEEDDACGQRPERARAVAASAEGRRRQYMTKGSAGAGSRDTDLLSQIPPRKSTKLGRAAPAAGVWRVALVRRCHGRRPATSGWIREGDIEIAARPTSNAIEKSCSGDRRAAAPARERRSLVPGGVSDVQSVLQPTSRPARRRPASDSPCGSRQMHLTTADETPAPFGFPLRGGGQRGHGDGAGPAVMTQWLIGRRPSDQLS